MGKLVITLNQHTPLIHFQGDQDGATIRATEFKPKLDKFLIEYAFPDGFNEYKQYLIGYKDSKTEEDFKDKKAFNYKLRFCNVVNWEKSDIKKGFPFYFNNIDKHTTDLNTFIFCDSIDVEFFSFNINLLKIINEWMKPFLLLTNFGFRQNKGFGSFYPENPECALSLLKEISAKKMFLYIQYDSNTKYCKIMQDASITYQLMKSGINFPSHDNRSYHKSYLFKYMLDKGIGNEKKFIKEKFFQSNLGIINDGMNKKYTRVMLGLSEEIEFKGKINGKIKYSSDIERFKSPIFFKIINNMMFIIPKDIPLEMYNKRFSFISNSKNEEEIFTLSEDEFNLSEFLESFSDFFNNHLKVGDAHNTLENKLRQAKINKIKVVK